MLEFQILSAAMMDRGCYNLVDKYIENKELTPEAQRVLKEVGTFYERDPSIKSVDRDFIEEVIRTGIPEHQRKHADIFTEFFRRIPKEVSVSNLSQYIIDLKRERVGAELHHALLSRQPTENIQKLVEKWRDIKGLAVGSADTDETYTGWDVNDLVAQHFDPKGLIKLLPASLNKRVDGGAKPGHHIFIFAPTEIGKTLFAVNLTYGFLRQNLRVLYLGNEDPIAEINMRVLNRISERTKHQVRENPESIKEVLDKANYKNFTIATASGWNFTKIREKTREHDPHVVVLDQLANFDAGANDTETLKFALNARQARGLGVSEHRLMISVGQASDNAYGRRILRKNDIQWSNVDVPGQLDLQLGIGATEEMEAMGTRTISFCKNKLSGDHTPLDVKFITEYSKVEELAV